MKRNGKMKYQIWIFYALSNLFICLSYASPALIKIPAGTLEPFWIESKDGSSTKLQISIAAIESHSHAVTNRDYIEFLRQNPKWRKSQVSPLFADENYLKQFADDLHLQENAKLNAPVTYISWYAANAYCKSLNLRLPNTNEWEYLASASETKREASRDSAFLKRILEWYSRPFSGSLPEVKSTYKNVYGLYDMHGLIWEWVEDFNSNLVTGESREDSSLDRNLFCGAGNLFGADKENYAAFMRFAFRSSMKGKSSVWNLGFRCIR